MSLSSSSSPPSGRTTVEQVARERQAQRLPHLVGRVDGVLLVAETFGNRISAFDLTADGQPWYFIVTARDEDPRSGRREAPAHPGGACTSTVTSSTTRGGCLSCAKRASTPSVATVKTANRKHSGSARTYVAS